MTVCLSCRGELPGGAKFCPSCGALVVETTPQTGVVVRDRRGRVASWWRGRSERWEQRALGKLGVAARDGVLVAMPRPPVEGSEFRQGWGSPGGVAPVLGVFFAVFGLLWVAAWLGELAGVVRVGIEGQAAKPTTIQ